MLIGGRRESELSRMSRRNAVGYRSLRTVWELAARSHESRAAYWAPAICQHKAVDASRLFEHSEGIAPLELRRTGCSISADCRIAPPGTGERCSRGAVMTGSANQSLRSPWPSSLGQQPKLPCVNCATHMYPSRAAYHSVYYASQRLTHLSSSARFGGRANLEIKLGYELGSDPSGLLCVLSRRSFKSYTSLVGP